MAIPTAASCAPEITSPLPEQLLPLYEQQLAQLFAMRRTTRKRTLQDVQHLLHTLTPADLPYPTVQIVGTNGKGSTAAFLASILEAAGYRTGLFTSPHLISFRERFRIHNHMVEDSQLAPLLDLVLQTYHRENLEPVFFDVTTLMACLLFAQEHVDIAIMEAGIGGRLDATTALPADLVILTEIGHDHNAWIGPTLEDIAHDKSAAFRPNKPAILGATTPHLQQIARQEAQRRQAFPVWGIGQEFPDLSSPLPPALPNLPDGTSITWWQALSPKLSGAFQRRNLGLALVAQHLLHPLGFSCSPADIQRGIAQVHWPARRQPFQVWGHTFWLDGAHNPHGMQALADSFDHPSVCMVYGAMLDKDIASSIAPFIPRLHSLILCPIQQPRAATPQELHDILAPLCSPSTHIHMASSLPEAMHLALLDSPSPALSQPILRLVCGSLFLAGEVLSWVTTLDNP